MAHTLASYQKDVKIGKSGAQRALVDFKIARKETVEAMLLVSSNRFLALNFLTSDILLVRS
jgi:hypothetical protein